MRLLMEAGRVLPSVKRIKSRGGQNPPYNPIYMAL